MLYKYFRKASLCRFISFERNRLPAEEVKKLLPEMQTVGYINAETHIRWNNMMMEHNELVERGERMRLLPCQINMEWIKFSSVDVFMLQMQSRYLSKLLDDFSNFGDRFLASLSRSPSACFWVMNGPIVIEKSSWLRLCIQVMSLLRVLGFGMDRPTSLLLNPWPDRELLESAAARAEHIFGQFARVSSSTRSISALYRQRPRGSSPAGTASLKTSSAKRRRRRAAETCDGQDDGSVARRPAAGGESPTTPAP